MIYNVIINRVSNIQGSNIEPTTTTSLTLGKLFNFYTLRCLYTIVLIITVLTKINSLYTPKVSEIWINVPMLSSTFLLLLPLPILHFLRHSYYYNSGPRASLPWNLHITLLYVTTKWEKPAIVKVDKNTFT